MGALLNEFPLNACWSNACWSNGARRFFSSGSDPMNKPQPTSETLVVNGAQFAETLASIKARGGIVEVLERIGKCNGLWKLSIRWPQRAGNEMADGAAERASGQTAHSASHPGSILEDSYPPQRGRRVGHFR